VLLTLFHDDPASDVEYARFLDEKVLERLRALDERVSQGDLSVLDPKNDVFASIGTEFDPDGKVTKNSYGVFNLSWQAQRQPAWAGQVDGEVRQIQRRIKEAHHTPLRFLIWAGMGGSAEDKSMYNAAGLLRRGVRCYVLDSTDPAKLKSILEHMQKRSNLSMPDVLRATLVVGMAMGMTSYEPVVNLEKLSTLYDKYNINGSPNFVCMALHNSVLDQFAQKQGHRRVELQLDNRDTTAGRHSAPLTRGSLYPLALARVDLRSWIEGTFLSDEEIHIAWRLAAFLHTQSKAGRDKITLLLPKPWAGAGIWSKQDFEESLGKSEEFGIKIVTEEKPKLANYRSPKDPLRQRTFWAVRIKGVDSPDVRKIGLLRRMRYPVAVLTFSRGTPLSRYMQFIHYTVFGIAYLRRMNFVTQPNVELYKTIAGRLYEESLKAGGIEKTKGWRAMYRSPGRKTWREAVTLHHNGLDLPVETCSEDAPILYASFLKHCLASRRVEYGELTFFGDMRYSASGRRLRKCLNRAAEKLFRARLKIPVDVYEGPAMNHSYHEMIIGHGKCFSTVLISERQEKFTAANYSSDYHRAQFLATQMALKQKGRPVVALTIKNLEDSSLEELDEFFHQAAQAVRDYKI
jgi:hypothetical protein